MKAPAVAAGCGGKLLVSAASARELDGEASRDWGFSPFALVEAAGRNCARRLVEWLGPLPPSFSVTALAGSGNNGADALVLLRALILEHGLLPQNAAALLNRLPEPDEVSPRAGAVRALQAMGVRVLPWEDGGEAFLESPRVIIDGIAGTGLSGPLRDLPLAMARAINRAREAGAGNNARAEDAPGEWPLGVCCASRVKPQKIDFQSIFYPANSKSSPIIGDFLRHQAQKIHKCNRLLVVSIDVPSGSGDGFKPSWPIVASDAVLAVEPAKLALYNPAARPFAGTILHVGGIFPSALIEKYAEAELVDWETVRGRIPAVAPDAYKYSRGVAEIRAGSAGSAGAAQIAAKGAQAAGAGLVRLAVDAALYPVLAASSGGIMVFESGSAADDSVRFRPDAVLLGPGWGRNAGRKETLEAALGQEGEGTPLILDADAIALARGRVFHGSTILTPHPGELANFAGVSREELADDPLSILKRVSREANAVILFKTEVLIAIAPEGSGFRLAVIDGMAPVLGTGGSGDLLAGFCAGIAARARAQSLRGGSAAPVDVFSCALAAAALLVACAKGSASRRFADPLDLARTAAALAGDAWLPAQ